MRLSKLHLNNVTVFRIADQIDMYCVKELKDSLDETFENGENKIIINIENIDYIDSSGIALFLFFNQKLLKTGHKLRLVINQNKSMLFNHFSIEKTMPLYYKEEFALNSFL